MTRALRPRPRRLAVSLYALVLLTGSPLLGAARAHAGPTLAGPRLTLAEATRSLPAAAALPPGDVTGFVESTVTKPTGLRPCNLAATSHQLDLHDNGAASGIYSTPVSAPVADLAQWVVSARVFASTAAAHAAVARLGVVERGCPTVAKVRSARSTTTFTRTWSARYVTAGGWHGYHTVDVITTNPGRSELRHIAVYLQKGNALIQVDEIAPVLGHSSSVQEARLLTVQSELAQRIDAAELT